MFPQCGVCGRRFTADLSGHSSSRPACFCIEQLNAWVEEIEFLDRVLTLEQYAMAVEEESEHNFWD